MRRLILLAFIGTFLIRNVTLSKVHGYPSHLEWLFSSSKLSDNEEEKRTVCESEECKKMADTLLGAMNRSADPCDDFYEYACGKWPEQNPIPKGYYEWSMFTMLNDKTNQEVKEIITAEPTENELKTVKLAKKWFKACMDTDAMEKQGIDPLVSTLSRLGGWPMIMEPDKWNEQEYSWQKVDNRYMRLLGRNAFYDVRVQINDTNVVEIDLPHLPPGSKQLRAMMELAIEAEETGDSRSDEDPSDEEEQSKEQPGSENKDHSKFVDNDNDDFVIVIVDDSEDNGDDNNDDNDGSGDCDDDDDDDNDDDDNDDDDGYNYDDDYDNYDDDDNDINENEDVKKKIGKKKITDKIGHGKNKKLHVRNSGTEIIKKHDSKTKRQRIRRWTITKVDAKRAQRFSRREKLHAQKGKKNHVKKVHRKKTKKILDNGETVYTTAIPQVNTEETNEDNENEIKLLQQYANYISKVARAVAKEEGTKISEERLNEDIKDMIEFQLKLIQISPEVTLESLSNPVNMEVTLGGLQQWYNEKNPKTANSRIDWVKKIKALFDEANESVDDNLNLDIIQPSYIANLVSLLDETSSRTIVNYIHWNFISRIIKTTTSEMRALYDSWETTAKGTEPSDRESICMESAEIKEILAYEFVRKYFSDDLIEITSNLLNDIQKTVEYLIKESDWMDDKAKDFALAKVKNLKKFIGYPKWYKNTTVIQEYYEGLIIGSSHYENTLRYNKFDKWKSLRKLSKNINEIEEEQVLNPIEVNAFYVPLRNAMFVMAADLQSPWFSYDRPRSVNYGMIGFVIAHEVNHGFDNEGHLYDKNGERLGWLSAMAGEYYNKRQDCFVEQFNKYPINKNTNETIKDYGKMTTGDNIADTMGLQTIFKAYERKEKESKTPDTTLPGMEDFTNNQLFFLSFASLWCEAVVDPSLVIPLAKADPEHSVGRLRIIGSVSNSDDFATTFNCPVGSPMNPEKKCNIWK